MIVTQRFPTSLVSSAGTPKQKQAADLTLWLWGINGARSVLASVLAVVIALGSGISAAFWTGVACYTIALMTYAWSQRTIPVAQPLVE